MMKKLEFDKDNLSAFDAISEAQKIAFAPMLFQAAFCLRHFGILAYLSKVGKLGADLDEICQAVPLNAYATELLLDMGLTSQLLYKKEDMYFLSKTGHFIEHDEMTRVNMDFTQYVCYQGLFSLKESLEQMRPIGLKVFGNWETIYPVLSQLPEPAKNSWFKFDHYYSTAAFKEACQIILGYRPELIYDLGGNTGKWALTYCQYDLAAKVVILDLPEQIVLMQENIKDSEYQSRISANSINILTDTNLPQDADIWWMSQFLDCFTKEQIADILRKIHRSMKKGAKVAIMELFWDYQPYKAGAFSLMASSFYFTSLANGNSRFYALADFERIVREAGFKIEQIKHNLGVGHTLLICSRENE